MPDDKKSSHSKILLDRFGRRVENEEHFIDIRDKYGKSGFVLITDGDSYNDRYVHWRDHSLTIISPPENIPGDLKLKGDLKGDTEEHTKEYNDFYESLIGTNACYFKRRILLSRQNRVGKLRPGGWVGSDQNYEDLRKNLSSYISIKRTQVPTRVRPFKLLVPPPPVGDHDTVESSQQQCTAAGDTATGAGNVALVKKGKRISPKTVEKEARAEAIELYYKLVDPKQSDTEGGASKIQDQQSGSDYYDGATTQEQLRQTQEQLRQTQEQLRQTQEQLRQTQEQLKHSHEQQLRQTQGQQKKEQQELVEFAGHVSEYATHLSAFASGLDLAPSQSWEEYVSRLARPVTPEFDFPCDWQKREEQELEEYKGHVSTYKEDVLKYGKNLSAYASLLGLDQPAKWQDYISRRARAVSPEDACYEEQELGRTSSSSSSSSSSSPFGHSGSTHSDVDQESHYVGMSGHTTGSGFFDYKYREQPVTRTKVVCDYTDANESVVDLKRGLGSESGSDSKRWCGGI